MKKLASKTKPRVKIPGGSDKSPAAAFLVPNPRRGVYVFGEIDKKTLVDLTPRILDLKGDSEEPITVYIDSPGGSVAAAETLVGLLKTPGLNGERYPLVTVATGHAISAAADLLAKGDYIVAYPHSYLHFHGTRTGEGEITVEVARNIETDLLHGNRQAALRLASSIFIRLLSSYERLSSRIREMREENAEKFEPFYALLGEGAIDLPSFAFALMEKVESPYDEMLANCLHKTWTVTGVLRQYNETDARKTHLPGCVAEAFGEKEESGEESGERDSLRLLNLLIASRVREEDGWNLSPWHFNDLQEDFEELSVLAGSHFQDMLLDQVSELSDELMSEEDWEFFESHSEEDLDDLEIARQMDEIVGRAYAKLSPLWTFTLTLCRFLNRGENAISPETAWWLGIIDEVAGTPLCRRPLDPQTSEKIRAQMAVGDFERFGL